MAKLWTVLAGRLHGVGSFFRFLWQQRMLWMIPLVVVLFLLGVLLIVGQQTVLAPFIYTLF